MVRCDRGGGFSHHRAPNIPGVRGQRPSMLPVPPDGSSTEKAAEAAPKTQQAVAFVLSYRLLLGVTFTGVQAWPGWVVGGSGLLSATVA